MKIACIGLGRMGWHMAAHLSRSNAHEVVVYDVQSETGQKWATDHEGTVKESVASATKDSDFIVTSLPADRELLAVAEEVIPSIAENAVWIDHSTTSAQAARDVGTRLNAVGAYFLDAPVSGGVVGAENGTISVMAGGDSEAFSRAEPIIDLYSGQVRLMGELGAGQLTKMTNQICVVGLCQALAEGLDFASRAGLDVENVIEAMLQGSSTSWQMENRADKMFAGEYDYGFSTVLMRKDVGLVLEEAAAMNISLPVTALVSQFLADVESMGGANWDWCSLMERQRGFAVPDNKKKDN
tara:strand:+ start:954 stop:1844 length:891 start_codon:yes stop_codon:yes gene_type:complete